MKIDLSNTLAVKNGLVAIQKDLEAVGYKSIEYVEKQLEKEIDVDGKKFPPYSARWKEYRASKGWNPSVVDLTITGHMLRSMDVLRANNERVVVGFNNQEAIRSAKGVLRNEKRPIQFMGLTKENRANLISWMWRKFTKRNVK